MRSTPLQSQQVIIMQFIHTYVSLKPWVLFVDNPTTMIYITYPTFVRIRTNQPMLHISIVNQKGRRNETYDEYYEVTKRLLKRCCLSPSEPTP